ncbi:MAG: DVU0298 family protein [Bacillota bacterium]
MEKIPLFRESIIRVKCPFCGAAIERPKEVETGASGQMPIGCCQDCGAVYAYDATGHNLGAAFVEALVFASNSDWDLAWSLLPEEDYQQKVVEKYDIETQCIVPGGVHEGRRVAGALYFVRLQEDVQEVTREGLQEKLERAAAVFSGPVEEEYEEKHYSKKDVEDMVRAYQIKPILQAARHDKKIVRHLQRLLCTNDELLRFRAIDILGKASVAAAATDPATVVALLQGLFYPFTYSNASNWGAIEAIGEIIASIPTLFAGYIGRVVQFLDDEQLRPRALWALGRIAQVRPDLLRKTTSRVLPFVNSADPETRGYAVWFLANMRTPEARQSLMEVQGGSEEISIYEEGIITKTTVGELVAKVLQ